MAEEKSLTIRIQFLETMATLITAGFGLVAALAWNDAIKALIIKYVPNDGAEIASMFLYAVIVTVIVVIASVSVARLLGKLKEADAKLEEKYSKKGKGSSEE